MLENHFNFSIENKSFFLEKGMLEWNALSHLFFFRTQTNVFCDTTAFNSVFRKCFTLWTLGGKKTKKASHLFNKNFKKLSRFTEKAKRFTEPEGETKHQPDCGLNHSFQAQRALLRPKVEVLKGSLSAHSTTSKYYYCWYCWYRLSAGFVNFLGSSKR